MGGEDYAAFVCWGVLEGSGRGVVVVIRRETLEEGGLRAQVRNR